MNIQPNHSLLALISAGDKASLGNFCKSCHCDLFSVSGMDIWPSLVPVHHFPPQCQPKLLWIQMRQSLEITKLVVTILFLMKEC